MKTERERSKELEQLLDAITVAIGRACSRDARLRSVLETLREKGLELRLHGQLRQARESSSGFALELRHHWSRTWSQEDVEVLHALGIALEEREEQLLSPKLNDHLPS